MGITEAVVVVLAGIGAGMINTIVGSGTLVTFPTLLAVGLPPVLANVSNAVGLAPGSIAGAWGYRRELSGQRGRLIRLGIGSTLGAITGALLLLVLPEEVFAAVVPVLILLGCFLVVIQPKLSAWLRTRREPRQHGGWLLWVFVYLTGVYGGYFGAAQGVLLVAILAISLDETLQRVNAAKNVLAGMVNLVAGLVFVLVASVSWPHAGLLAGGAILGGLLGASVGRRLPPIVLRVVIVIVGLVAVVNLLR